MWLFQMFLYLTTFIVIFLSSIYLYFKYKYTFWSRQNIPYLKPIFPYGNTKSLVKLEKSFAECFIDIYKNIKQISKHFGGIYMFSRPSLMITDPELIKTILTKDFSSFQDRGMFLDEETNPLWANLITLRGQRWKTMRGKLTPTFTSGKMRLMFQIMQLCSQELNNIIEESINQDEPINTKEIFSRLTTDTIGSCAFGLDCNSLRNPDAEFRQNGKKVFELNFRTIIVNILATNFPSLLRVLKVAQIEPDVTNFFMSALKETITYRETNKIVRKDFLNLLIELMNQQPSEITFNELAAQAFAFFTAGFETSSSTLNFCLFELSLNETIQENTRREINNILRENNNEITYENIMEMKYMDKVINEVLRKYPPIPTLQRECNKDYKIPGHDYTIKTGTKIVIPSMGMHYDEEYFPEPQVFNPERFTEEVKKTRHPYTYLPFGEGPRICIGMRFALLQVKIALTMLLKDYKFSLDKQSITPIIFNPKSIFLSPKNDIFLRGTRL